MLRLLIIKQISKLIPISFKNNKDLKIKCFIQKRMVLFHNEQLKSDYNTDDKCVHVSFLKSPSNQTLHKHEKE